MPCAGITAGKACCSTKVLQNDFEVVPRIVTATAAHSELCTDIAKGLVRVAAKSSRISLAVLAKFPEQVERRLDVPVLIASLQLCQGLKRAVSVSKLARSLGQLGAWSLRKVVVAASSGFSCFRRRSTYGSVRQLLPAGARKERD